MDYIPLLSDPGTRLLAVGAVGTILGGIKEGYQQIKNTRAILKLRDIGVLDDRLNPISIDEATEEMAIASVPIQDTLDKNISNDNKLTWAVALTAAAGGVSTAAYFSTPIKDSYALETGLDFVVGSMGSAIGKHTIGKLIGLTYTVVKELPNQIKNDSMYS